MLRVSTNMIYGQNMMRLSTLQAQLMKTQQHMSANTRLLTPADDPVAAARALDLKQGKSMNTQFAHNRGTAGDALKLQESTLNSVGSRIQDIQTLLVSAGNGAYSGEQYRVLANELRGLRDEMVGYANTRDPYGDYIFSGNQVGVQPFDMSPTGQVTYQGDIGKRMLQIDAARFMAVSDPGSDIFMGIKGTTASTVESSDVKLAGDIKIKDESQLVSGNYYKVTFTGNTPVAQYAVELFDSSDVSQGIVATGDYTGRDNEPMVLVHDGVEISVKGPADGSSSVTIRPGEPIRSDLFSFINDAIALLESPQTDNASSTNMALGLESLIGNFATALDQVLTVRGSSGTRLKELDALDTAGLEKNEQYTQSISDLEDLDYYKAISDLIQQQMTLQAAQKTFMQISGLSLFNLM